MSVLRSPGDCPVCTKPLYSAFGQVIRFHKECRAEGRKRFGRSTGITKIEIADNLFGIDQSKASLRGLLSKPPHGNKS